MKTIITPNMIFYGNNVFIKLFVQLNYGDCLKGETIIKLFIEHSNANVYEVLLNEIFWIDKKLEENERKELENKILKDIANYFSKNNIIDWEELKKIIEYNKKEI